jgi:hypothetical protein
MNLGNVKDGPEVLCEAWNAPPMKYIILRPVYDAPRATYLNAVEEKCYSCVGRCRTLEMRTDPQDGQTPVSMEGCWNNRAD